MDGTANNPHLLIRASAGTGKTFQLSNRYLSLILRGCSPDRILAATFTRKAAGEILARVLARLAKAATSDSECQALASDIGQPLTITQCRDRLREVISLLHRVRVGTLDSFFGQVAHSVSLEVGLPPSWGIADVPLDQWLQNRSIEMLLEDDRNVSESDTASRLVRMLKKGELKRAINDALQDTVESAYALYQGSDRAAWTGLKRRTELDDGELDRTLEELRECDCSGPDLSEARVRTFEKKRDELYTWFVNEEWDNILTKGILSKVVVGVFSFNRAPIPPLLLDVLQRLKEYLRNHFVNQTAAINESTFTLLTRFSTHYNRLKFDSGSFGFDDIPRLLTQVIQGNPGSHITFRIDGQIDHLLLDEFQDTSRTQWEALAPFARDIVRDSLTISSLRSESIESATDDRPVESGPVESRAVDEGTFKGSLVSSKSLFCVGDVKQAIYGWRGGMPEIFDHISSQFSIPESSLDRSFRSAQPIIDVVNATFEGIPNHRDLGRLSDGVQQWVQDFPQHSTARTELKGYAELCVTPEVSPTEKSSDVAIRSSVELAVRLHEEAPGRSIGLLVRGNATVAEAISQFKRLGIPASEEGGNPLTDSAAVSVVYSVLKMADHPGDSVASCHVCQSPLAQRYGLSPATKPRSRAVVAAAHAIREELLADGYGACVERWSRQLRALCDDREWTRIQQLVTMAYRHEATLLPRDFLARIDTEKITDPTAATIRVMNVHQSKGLQFDIVILGELEKKLLVGTPDYVATFDQNTFKAQRICRYVGEEVRALLPESYQRIHDETIARQIQEEMCILYVAMTRAVHALHMVVTPTAKKASAKTFAGLLRASLHDNGELEPNTIAYQVGDPDWHAESGTQRTAPTDSESRSSLESGPKIHLRAPTRSGASFDLRGLRRLRPTTPSGLEGGPSLRLQPRTLDETAALEMGTLFHAWMERIEWIENGVPSRADLESIASELGVEGRIAEVAMDGFHKAMSSRSLQSILEKRSYAESMRRIWRNSIPTPPVLEVRNEQRIAVRRGGDLLNGSIDRLVVARHDGEIVAAEVIDFKTDRFRVSDGVSRSEAATDKISHYRPQMVAYRDAVAQMLRLDPKRIGMQLSFVLESENHHVTETPTRSAN